jgi:hypothetical protein
MKQTKVLLNFFKFPIPIRIIFYRSIISHLTGNANFLVPSVSLDLATAAVDALAQCSVAAKDGAHITLANRNDAEKAADAIFRNLASYVEFIALGDDTIIISSGFSPTKQPVPHNKSILRVVHSSHSGCLKFSTVKGPRSHACMWRLRKVSTNGIENPWIAVATTTQTTYEATGLEVGVAYEVSVADVTPEGIGDYCQPVTIIVI